VRPNIRFSAAVLAAVLSLSAFASEKATPGLPFVEDFANPTLRADGFTNALWSADDQTASLGFLESRRTRWVTGLDSFSAGRNNLNSTGGVVADFNGDGHLDLAVSNRGATNRLILGDSTIEPFDAINEGLDIGADTDDSRCIAAGDIDGDGFIDVAVGNALGTPVKVYLNNGTADPFGSVVAVPVGDGLNATAVVLLEDFNGDGRPDLFAGKLAAQDWLYLYDGAVAPYSSIGSGTLLGDPINTTAAAAGDIDGDGLLDLVTASDLDTFGGGNTVYFNDGTGNPFDDADVHLFSSISEDTSDIALGDINNDGRLDVVASLIDQLNVFYLNAGGRTPFTGGSIDIGADGADTFGCALADMDGDGDLDFIAGDANQPSTVLLNNGSQVPFDFDSPVIPLGLAPNTTAAVVVEDMNNDGLPDVMALNENLEENQIFMNLGNLETPYDAIATGEEFTTGLVALTEIAVGDVNGDGLKDAVAAGMNNGFGFFAPGVFFNDGTGSPYAAAPQFFGTVEATRAVVMGDVNGDGLLDVVLGNFNDFNQLFLHNGTVDPYTGGSLDVGNTARNTTSLALADMNRDGRLDVVEGVSGAVNRIYFNGGGLNPFVTALAGSPIGSSADATVSIAVADIDGDGWLDVVSGNQGALDRVHYNDNGSFAGAGAGEAIGGLADATSEVVAADFNGDGRIDIAVSVDSAASSNKLYLHNGSSTPFTGVVEQEFGLETDVTRCLASGDVDGDGDLDLIAGTSALNRIFINDGSSVEPFGTASDFFVPGGTSTNTTQVVIADIDNDGGLDWLSANSNATGRFFTNLSPARTAVYRADTDSYGANRDTPGLALGDVNGDGLVDIVEASVGAPGPQLYLNTGTRRSAVFSGTGTPIGSDTTGPRCIALGDLNRDGLLDVVMGRSGATNKLFLNDGAGDPFDTAGAGLDIGSETEDTRSIAVGYINGDGLPDVAVGNGGAGERNRVYLAQNTANPFQSVPTGSPVGADTEVTTSIALADLNRDGRTDVVTGSTGSAVRLYLNAGDADLFTLIVNGTVINGAGFATQSVALADVDVDGDIDVITGNLSDVNQVHINDGSTTPYVVTPITLDVGNAADDTRAILAEDWDGNGRPDLLAVNEGGPHKLYFNYDATLFDDSEAGIALEDFSGGAAACGAAGDIDGDGSVDLVVGAGGDFSRIYWNRSRNAHAGRTRSLTVNTGESLSAVRLTGTADLGPNAPVDFYLSLDGGARWLRAESGRTVLFPAPGTDLRWRAELSTFSPVFSPVVSLVDIKGDQPPTAVCQDIEVELDEDGLATIAPEQLDGGSFDDLDTPVFSVDIDSFDCTDLGPVNVTLTVEAGGQQSTCVAVVTVVDVTPPAITLNGSETETVECGDTYFEQGATALDACSVIPDTNIVVGGFVLTNLPGEYILTYNVTDDAGNPALEVTRTVTVKDTTPPTLSLNGLDPVTVECGGSYSDDGAISTDTCEGDVSGLVVTALGVLDENAVGSYTVTYSGQDSSGNSAAPITRTVNVIDTTRPDITLTDGDSVVTECGVPYVDPGYRADDSCGGDITGAVVVSGDTPDTSLEGSVFVLRYNVQDASGNPAIEVIRTVAVVDTKGPSITLNGPNPLFIDCGDTFVDPGATAVDDCDGALALVDSDADEAVDPNVRGTYVVTYRSEDSAGFVSIATRDVVVRDNCDPEGEGEGSGEGEDFSDNFRIEVYVSGALGSDESGDGSPGLPWRTIGFALEQVRDLATAARPAAVVVLEGEYDETVVVPAHTRLIGFGPEATVIAPSAATLEDEAVVVDLEEGSTLQEIAIVLPEDAPPSRTGIRINNVSARVDRVVVDGNGALSSFGIQIFGPESSGSRVVDSVFRNLFGAVRAIDTCAEFFRCAFESVLGDAVTVLENARKGADCTLNLGDASRPEETGSNRFVDIGGLFVRNLTDIELPAENNSFGTDDLDVIGGGLGGPVGFGGVLSSSFALTTLFVTVRTEGNAPIGNAEVTALAQGSSTLTPSQTPGVYVANITAGLYSVTARASGFQTQTQVQPIGAGTEELVFIMVQQLSPPPGTHAMDSNSDNAISLSETLRVVQLYNATSISCGPQEEDGYQLGPAGGFDCLRHSADYSSKSWRVSLSEILRVVQFYNVGAFFYCPGTGTEDGYCLGG
jgi:hypothetical protein